MGELPMLRRWLLFRGAFSASSKKMIKKLRIKNFKSLRDVTVELGSITILIGRSGTGKSNFFNALAFLKDYLSATAQKRNEIEADRILTATAPRQTERPDNAARNKIFPAIELEFEVTFATPGFEGDFWYELRLALPIGGRQLIPSRESLIHDNREVFSRNLNSWATQPNLLPLPEIPNHMVALPYLNGISEAASAYVALSSGIGCYDFSGSVMQPKQRGQAQEHSSDGLVRDARNFLDCLEDINRNQHDQNAQREITAALRRLKPSLKGAYISHPDRSKVLVSLEISGRTLSIELSQESEGFRRFFAHLIAIYQVPPKQLLCFEEPEKGLYPGALTTLAEQLKAYPVSRRGQVLVTTHSPALLDCFEPDAIRVVDLSDEFETKIGPISKEQLESVREHLLTTGELLTVDPAHVATTASDDNA